MVKKKKFAVTVLNNETRVFHIEAENADEAREMIEEPDFKEVMKKHKSHVIHAEFVVDDISEDQS